MALLVIEGFNHYGRYDWGSDKYIEYKPQGASLNHMVPDMNLYPSHIRDEVGFLRRQATEKREYVLGQRLFFHALKRFCWKG